ncbi:3-oxoacyl-ACP synthase [Winogradskyella algicola]|uniref:3-oxoacyl-ACP synthase n=1 Tax=Winogradskyella algicola TaxID=2575815 RepID=UPI001FE67A01|nr:3-oxoacyl-ACP synthase [Winogradskyella algicola]
MAEEIRIKQHLYTKCQDALNSRLKVLRQKILDLQSDLQSETKSSAGDKHETGRAMLQLEREKAGQQLAEIQKQSDLLNRINTQNIQDTVALGSIVYTTQTNYFLAVSVGEINFNEISFFAISPATPVAKLLISKTIGDTVKFRDKEIAITKIL